MNKIIVFAVPASRGGALTILNEYYQKALEDKDNEYVFVVSVANLNNSRNIKVLKYPWIKKSWLHRLWFEVFHTKKIVDQIQPTKIISLQNTYIKNKRKIYQTIYMHQSIPYTKFKFSLLKEPKLWFYQNILGKIINKSVKNADKVLVQTQWIKNAIIEKNKIQKDKIEVIYPQVNLDKSFTYKRDGQNRFFYPANAASYKNHEVIIKACLILKEQGIKNYKIYLTIKGDETKHIKKLKRIAERNNLPVEFIGTINYYDVQRFYSKSTLIFPSYLETFGLPLLEASIIGSPIIASDMPFSREIIKDYKNAVFFTYNDFLDLSDIMKQHINDF